MCIRDRESKLRPNRNEKSFENQQKPLDTSTANNELTKAKHNNSSNLKIATAVDEEVGIFNYMKFDHVLELIKQKRDVKLLIDIESGLRLVSYRPGYIEFTPTDLAPANLAQRLSNRLKEWTGIRWAVSVVQDGEAQTIIEKKERNAKELETEAYSHPFVKEALVQFPAARIVNVISRKKLEEEAAIQALEEVDSEWDPFEED